MVPTSSTVIGTQFGTDVLEIVLDLSPVLLEGTFGTPTVYWVSVETPNPIAPGNTAYLEATTVPGSDNLVVIDDNDGGWFTAGFQSSIYTISGNCVPKDPSIFPSPYCGPLDFSREVVPITLVEVAGIDNRSSEVIDASPSHEDYTAIVGSMEEESTYTITLEGNTGGDFTDFYTIFIDWNQDEILDSSNERYDIGTITNSTGIDGVQITGTITVPSGVVEGPTRMRVIKTFDAFTTDSCIPDSLYGQAEDYTIQVGLLGIADNSSSGFTYYPNPTNGVINIAFSNGNKIENAIIYNMTGQKLLDVSNTNTIDISNFSTGMYILKTKDSNNNIITKRIIKN